MRWFIQIIVMLGDLFLIAACIVALTYAKNSPGNYILIYLACWVWYGQGGFIAWTHPKKFLENAKKYGL